MWGTTKVETFNCLEARTGLSGWNQKFVIILLICVHPKLKMYTKKAPERVTFQNLKGN